MHDERGTDHCRGVCKKMARMVMWLRVGLRSLPLLYGYRVYGVRWRCTRNREGVSVRFKEREWAP
jgi:hypothetical protein